MENKNRKVSTPSPKSAKKPSPSVPDGDKKRFEQMLDDAVLGIKKK